MKKANKILTVIFEEGEEIVSGLKKALREKKVEEAFLNSVFGSIKEFDLNYLVAGQYKKMHFIEPHKLHSIHGLLKEKGNLGYKGDLVVSLSNPKGTSLGGILLKAKTHKEAIIKAKIIKFK